MSLSRAGIIASQSLASVSTQIDTVSRNIAGVNTPGYSVKTALIYTGDDGGSHSKAIARAANLALFKNSLQAASGQAALSPLSDGLSQLDSFFNLSSGSASDSVDNHSPAALIASLASALQQYGADPSNATSAQTALASAQALVQGLNSATNETQQIREDADASISVSVSNINSILSEFEKVNKDIVVGSQTGDDITDKLDQRDNLLTQLSKEVGIKTVTRPNNDVMIYTDSGVTLFETSPRKVTFKPTNAFDAATVGNAVYADGVQITGSDANMSVQSTRWPHTASGYNCAGLSEATGRNGPGADYSLL